MARAIDGDKLVENLRLIATCWSISPFVSKEKHNGAVNMLREVEREVKEMSTLIPPNEPLTLEQLREMDEPTPVWWKRAGFWCLCERGFIIAPNGNIYEFEETDGIFYRHPPEGDEDA